MLCPECGKSAKVIDSRQRAERKYRRHACSNGKKKTAYEIHEKDVPEKEHDIAGQLTVQALGILVAKSVASALPSLVDAITKEIMIHIILGGEPE